MPIGILPEFHSWIVRIGNFLRLPHAGVVIEKIANDTIAKFRQPELMVQKDNPNSDPFISKLLRLEAAGKADWYNIMDAIGGNIAAGSDTTAITLSAALYYLYRTPRALAGLRKEIDEMEKAGKISDPVSFKEAQEMSYLQAVFQETLRLHPAVAYVLPRKVPKGGMELAGRWFPEGTGVGVSAWALHQNSELYGDDASEFRPERFLGNESGSKNQTASLASSFAFGGGTRTCIGKNISLLEMTKVLPQIVRKFDLVFESDEPWELYTTWFVWQKYYCYIEPRKS
ncbi:Pisatin demethylase [Pseudocercospora fuligena]|uniref:Pisatin demethylase n=1 Tax=Pseudocercospora fuligena TaxID=685502 RepID=A0A8H6RNV2_9PEZI|nr:Pisatin demethylase [Pseudocercospora fuligena]